MLTKILGILGKANQEIYDGEMDTSILYPEMTKRIVSEYLVFNKTLEGKTRRGRQYIEQMASIDIAADSGEVFHYNIWQDLRFIDKEVVDKITKMQGAEND